MLPKLNWIEEKKRKYFIEIDSNCSHICGADSRHREEAVLPLTRVDDPLVYGEDFGEAIDKRWSNTQQMSGKVSPEVDIPFSRWVEAVVVPWGQVYDARV